MTRSRQQQPNEDKEHRTASPPGGRWAVLAAASALALLAALVCVRLEAIEAYSVVQRHIFPSTQLAQKSALLSLPINVTFVNLLEEEQINLFWHGPKDSGARAVFGPIAAGSSKTMETVTGDVCSMVVAGTLEPLVEHEIRFGVTEYPVSEPNSVSMHRTERAHMDAAEAHTQSAAEQLVCRSHTSCAKCVAVAACGWSVVRRSCLTAHPIASENTKCSVPLEAAASRTAAEWLHAASAHVSVASSEDSPQALQAAYFAVGRALEASELESQPVPSAISALHAELSAKLEAVFDDVDALELLDATRHKALAKAHPNMQVVPRLPFEQAKAYVKRSQPVVITDLSSPVAQRWTLDYLDTHTYKGTVNPDGSPLVLNIAADTPGACCRYYEPLKEAVKRDYPFPFQPRTHLYRDTFADFVKTIRSTNGSTARPLHYLHDSLIAADGKPFAARTPAVLAADLAATTDALRKVVKLQPFFGGFASAKLWVGERGITMPMHYDTGDNVHIMAWGRKRVIIGDPGQLTELFRFPSGHPLAGSSRVNISLADLARHPRFSRATLSEAVIGPGDTLYLPSWWWHQFEQPFEGTGALNMWTRAHASDWLVGAACG